MMPFFTVQPLRELDGTMYMGRNRRKKKQHQHTSMATICRLWSTLSKHDSYVVISLQIPLNRTFIRRENACAFLCSPFSLSIRLPKRTVSESLLCSVAEWLGCYFGPRFRSKRSTRESCEPCGVCVAFFLSVHVTMNIDFPDII